MKRLTFLFFLLTTLISANAQQADEKQLLLLVDEFFAALEKQDTITFRNMFLDKGYIYAVREINTDSVVVRSIPHPSFKFRTGQILKERMRKATTSVKVDGRIAMVWAPYDLWVNETFSHCGVDVFTFIKTKDGWKISSIAYTIETEGCN